MNLSVILSYALCGLCCCSPVVHLAAATSLARRHKVGCIYSIYGSVTPFKYGLSPGALLHLEHAPLHNRCRSLRNCACTAISCPCSPRVPAARQPHLTACALSSADIYAVAALSDTNAVAAEQRSGARTRVRQPIFGVLPAAPVSPHTYSPYKLRRWMACTLDKQPRAAAVLSADGPGCAARALLVWLLHHPTNPHSQGRNVPPH